MGHVVVESSQHTNNVDWIFETSDLESGHSMVVAAAGHNSEQSQESN